MAPLKSALSTPQSLNAELDGIMQSLESDISVIATEIDRPGQFDSAKVRMAVSRVRQLSHRFMQFLPQIAASRRENIEANGLPDPAEDHTWGMLNTRVFTARNWINQWPHIERLVQGQNPPKRRKLYVEPNETIQSQHHATDALMSDLHAILNTSDQNEDARLHGCYADIALPHSHFMAHLHAACRVTLAQNLPHPPRFLDVGCGGGLKVLSARAYFERADGLEYDQGYVTQAEHLFERSKFGGCKVIHADGLTWGGYDRYDVIYFYRPMRDIELLRALERQITSTAQRGTLIIAPYEIFDHRYEAMGCARLMNRLYGVGMTKREAASLRRRAELIGPNPRLDTSPVSSIWDPILSASRRNGYGTTL